MTASVTIQGRAAIECFCPKSEVARIHPASLHAPIKTVEDGHSHAVTARIEVTGQISHPCSQLRATFFEELIGYAQVRLRGAPTMQDVSRALTDQLLG